MSDARDIPQRLQGIEGKLAKSPPTFETNTSYLVKHFLFFAILSFALFVLPVDAFAETAAQSMGTRVRPFQSRFTVKITIGKLARMTICPLPWRP
jgi:hypothetical protein